ncbi:Intradiol ring-cleavage dioxygenase [Infundibulicybe gibba]|nr:Intradiol ring-cleavage dioxygenase [Infundibulicybe gibba]
MLSFPSLLIALLPLLSLQATAHKEPKTPKEIEVQRALQAAAITFCAPAVEQYTAARKRSWAQKVLTGRPSLPDYTELFESSNYDGDNQETLMGCTPIQKRISKITLGSYIFIAPEVTTGPYYHTAGHPIRQNIAEYQHGLLLLLDIGVIDVETCKPLPNVLVDIWQANATGHYAGHPVPAPHLVHEKPQVGGKRSGLLNPFPRTNYVETPIFFDDDVNVQVDKMHPYTDNPILNTIGRTRNWRDSLNIFEDSHGPEGQYDPVFKLHLLGGIIGQGLVGYITMGVNASASYSNPWMG